jgi:1-acyl-sn-glycerol-3-phosphate acyltransferase
LAARCVGRFASSCITNLQPAGAEFHLPHGGTIPIAGRKEDIQIYEKAFTRIAQYLKDGELVCIFPEGKLTADGEINEFKGGLTRILEETPVPVIPLALQGLWGSFFSRDPNKGLFRRLWSRVTLVAGPAVAVEVRSRPVAGLVGELRGAVRC